VAPRIDNVKLIVIIYLMIFQSNQHHLHILPEHVG
jgi:hypothetical protein